MTVEFCGKVRDRDDFETSWAAAESQTEEKVSGLRLVILDLLAAEPATDERLIERYGQVSTARRVSPQSIRSRRSELVLAGLVKATDQTRLTQCGHPARVWEADGCAFDRRKGRTDSSGPGQ